MILTDELVDNLPGGKRQDEQAVIICLQFPVGKLQEQKAIDALSDLGDIFSLILETSCVGRFERIEYNEEPDVESVAFFMYGTNANHIYAEIKPILQCLPNLPEFSVFKQYSQLDSQKKYFNLS